MALFEKQNKMAEDILTKHRGKVLAIEKATRAGATFSLLKRACELKQKTVIIAPYIEIFDKTVNEVASCFEEGKKPRIARISKNSEICEKVAEKLDRNPSLKSMPFHFRPTCKNCEYNDPDLCRLQEILQSEWDILGLTYAKLKALSMGKSQTVTDLFEKIKAPNNLILDEFVTGIIVSAPSFEIVEPYNYLKEEFNPEILFIEKYEKKQKEAMFWHGINLFAIYVEAESDSLQENGEFKFFPNHVKEDVKTFFEDNLAKCWNIIEKLRLEGKNTKKLEKLMQIVTSEVFYALKKDGKISIKPAFNIDDISSGSTYLKKFIHEYKTDDKIIALVDSCLPDLDLTEDLSTKVDFYNWGDPLFTNESQLIVCDTRKISKTDFFKERGLQSKLVKFIKAASEEYKPKQILIATQNKKMHSVLKQKQKRGLISKEIMITYYRSDLSRGTTIDPDQKVLILIGGPYLPKEAYVPETMTAKGPDEQRKLQYKKSDMKSAFINLIGRVKDSTSAFASVVYALGLTKAEVKLFIEQEKVPSPHVLNMLVNPAKAEDFFLTSEIFFDYGRDRYEKISEDIPVLVRIINKTKNEGKVACGKIMTGHTKKIQKITEKHRDILEDYNIRIETARNGCNFIYSEN